MRTQLGSLLKNNMCGPGSWAATDKELLCFLPHIALSSHKLQFCTSIDPNCTTQISICGWPSLERTHHMFLLDSNHFHNTRSGPSPVMSMWLKVCRTSLTFLRDSVKSCAVPDGAGGTSEASRLGQEAAFCSEEGRGDKKWHTGVKKTIAPLLTSAKPKIPVLFICRRRKWEGKVLLWGETTIASNRWSMGGLEKQTHRTLGQNKKSLFVCLWPTLCSYEGNCTNVVHFRWSWYIKLCKKTLAADKRPDPLPENSSWRRSHVRSGQ